MVLTFVVEKRIVGVSQDVVVNYITFFVRALHTLLSLASAIRSDRHE